MYMGLTATSLTAIVVSSRIRPRAEKERVRAEAKEKRKKG